MIEVEAPDGTVVEFPDGTSRDVMRQAMARKFGGGAPAPRAAAPAPKAAPKAAPVDRSIFQLADDFTAPIAQAWETVRANAKARQNPTGGLGSTILGDVTNTASLIGLGASPLQGLAEALFIRPAGRAIAQGVEATPLPVYDKFDGENAPRQLEGDERYRSIEKNAVQSVNLALMGARPAPAKLGPPRPPQARSAAPAMSKAEQRVAQAVERAIVRDQMTPDEAILALDPKAPAYLSGGENLITMAEIAAQSPGKAATTIRTGAATYKAQAGDRMKGAIGQGLGGKGDYFETLDKSLAGRKARAMPLQEKAFAAPVDEALYAEKVAPIMPRVPNKAKSFAMEIAKRDGVAPEELGFRIVGEDGGLPVVEQVTTPTMKTLHYLKKGMDQDLEQFRNPLGKLDLEGQPMAASTARVRSELARSMREVNPDYDKFMQVWGDESGQIEAMRLGRNSFSPKPDMSFERLKKTYGAMSQTERDMYRKGLGEALIAKVRSAKGGVGTARDLLKSEEFSDKIRLGFPDDGSFIAFSKSVEREVRNADKINKVTGGSPTYARAAARADLEAQGSDGMAMLAEAIDTGLSPSRLTATAVKQALKSIPKKDRSIIGDPVLNEALGKALNDPDEMARLLKLLQAQRAAKAGRQARISSGVRAVAPLAVPAAGAASAQRPEK